MCYLIGGDAIAAIITAYCDLWLVGLVTSRWLVIIIARLINESEGMTVACLELDATSEKKCL